MIKNETPYIGKIKLKFEKDPYWRGSSKLNKIHLNLGFTKLVSRIYPESDVVGWKIHPEVIAKIEKETGLTIGTYKFGPNEEFELPKSALTPTGEYVGGIEEAWWYLQEGLKAVKGCHPHTAWSNSAKQWIGYSHRASCAFGKGDKLFDPNWVPSDEDLRDYEKYFLRKISNYDKRYEEWEKSTSPHKATKEDMTLAKWAVEYIPFRLRGSKAIRSYEDAYQAAVNFAKYVS